MSNNAKLGKQSMNREIESKEKSIVSRMTLLKQKVDSNISHRKIRKSILSIYVSLSFTYDCYPVQ